MKQIKQDFIGLWVNAGGYIARPAGTTRFKVGEYVKTYHFGGSTKAGVGKDRTCRRGQYLENWVTTGTFESEIPLLKKKVAQPELEKHMRNSWLFYQDKPFDQDMLFEWCEITRNIYKGP